MSRIDSAECGRPCRRSLCYSEETATGGHGTCAAYPIHDTCFLSREEHEGFPDAPGPFAPRLEWNDFRRRLSNYVRWLVEGQPITAEADDAER